MNQINEALLNAWLRLSTSVINNRLVSEMSYNESLVCGILYRHSLKHTDQKLTATDMCAATNMLKSQMNRTLNQLEKKSMITRERSTVDKRQVWLSFNMEQAEAYKKQHDKILQLVDGIVNQLGEDKAMEAIKTLNTVADAANQIINVQ